MDAGRGVGVLDIYNWLPPYGETTVQMHSTESDYVVEIEFDSENARSGPDLKIKLIFKSVCSFYKAAFPGAEIIAIKYGKFINDSDIHCLVEYPNSEVASAWEKYFGKDRKVKHYSIFFLSANLMLEVFATEFIMEGPFTIEQL